MELLKTLQVFKKYLLPLSLFCLSATLHAFLITYALSEKYTAESLVLVRPQKSMSFPGYEKRREVVDFPLQSNIPFEVTSKTFKELIKSRAIAQKIVNNLTLEDGPLPAGDTLKEKWMRFKKEVKIQLSRLWDLARFGRIIEVDAESKFIGKVQKSLSVNPTRKSYVFEISALWKDPQTAAAIVNEASSQFVIMLSEITLNEAAQTRKLLEKRLLETGRLLQTARKNLKDFKEINKSVAYKKELEEKIEIISELETDLEKSNVVLSGLLKKFSTRNPQVLKVKGEVDRLASSVQRRKKELMRLPFKELELANLKLKVDVMQTTYKMISNEYEQSRIQEVKSRGNDVRVIAPAIASPRPVKPIKVFYAAAAFFMSFLLGILLILIYDAMDEFLDNIERVEKALDIPVIATVPLRRFF